ncbi:MAG: hypothetical protein ABI649_00900 [Gaiellaceae bacterium]
MVNRARAVVLCAVFVLASAFGAGNALASPCVYHRATKVVTATATEALDAAVVRSGRAIRFRVDGTTYRCGRATVTNTNRIDVTGTGVSGDVFWANFVTIDESQGRLAPGAKLETTGASEIEVRVSLTPGISAFPPNDQFPLHLTYVGTSRRDVERIGVRGLDLNGDGDVDVRRVSQPFEGYSLYGLGGADVLSGAGSRATGLPVQAPVTLEGGPGNDLLRGGKGNDSVVGEGGADKLFGGDGDDVFGSPAPDGADTMSGGLGIDAADYGGRSGAVNVSLDALANDGAALEHDNVGPSYDVEKVVGGAGDDTLVGHSGPNILKGGAGADTITGSLGQDELYGEAGDDTLHANDEIHDIVDGGADNDSAVVDDQDTVADVEFVTLIT